MNLRAAADIDAVPVAGAGARAVADLVGSGGIFSRPIEHETSGILIGIATIQLASDK